jgi:hypothetical protein
MLEAALFLRENMAGGKYEMMGDSEQNRVKDGDKSLNRKDI